MNSALTDEVKQLLIDTEKELEQWVDETAGSQGRRHAVDGGVWGGHVHPTFARGCSCDW